MTISLGLGGSPESVAVSDQSQVFNDLEQEVESHQSLPAVNNDLAIARMQLVRLYREYNSVDWDGRGASAITPQSRMITDKFLRLIDNANLNYPELEPELDGSVELVWHKSSDFIFSINLRARGLLGYSGYYGHKKRVMGTEPFDLQTQSISDDVKVHLNKFL